MKFTLALAMCPPERLLPLARAADDAGWDAVALPDSVFFPEQVSAPYPFTADGERFWAPDTPFVEPFVGMAAMAAATERLGFVTNVLKSPLREPLLIAKTVSSLAALFPGRIELGLGLSYLPEEYRWLSQDKSTRGARLDEQIEIIRKVLGGGWVEHHGRHYDFDRLLIAPVPPADRPVPIHIGGHSDAAMRRAVQLADGWIGAQAGRDELAELLARMAAVRTEAERGPDGFEAQATPLVPATVEAMADLSELGLTGVITMPWYFAGGDPADPAHQLDSVRWFADTVIHPLRAQEAAS